MCPLSLTSSLRETKQTKVAGSRECKNLGGSGFALVFLSFDFSQRCTAMETLRTQPDVPRRNPPEEGMPLVLAPAEVTSLTYYMNLHGKNTPVNQ